MTAFLLRRLLQTLLVAFLVSVLVFSIILLIPGDPATAMLGELANEQDIALLKRKLGLDQPLYMQYLHWVGNAIQGDLGRSMHTRFPVTELIARALPYTIQLALCGMILAVVIGIPAGLIAARRHGKSPDMVMRGLTTIGMAMPNFWLGILLILVFSLWLDLLPPSGIVPISESFRGWATSMILPALTIAASFTAVVVRQTRSAFLEVLRTDYIRTARAKGLPEYMVITPHALRNVLIPVLTVVGLQTGRLLGGAVVTETIFSIPGMGSLIVEGVNGRDFVVVQAGIMVAALGVLGINLLVDVLYGVIDPRIRLAGRS
ncbi:MAG: ABC transporter permease [Geminicoccaceae bacterium]